MDRWKELSLLQRAARAFRYAGYHFEGDGSRQSSYRFYRLSAYYFERDGRLDEASRSHFLALDSYVRRFGSLESSYVRDLERTTRAFVNYDEVTFLNRMVIYYRKIGAILRAEGNYADYLTMRRSRLDAQRRLFRASLRDWHKYLALSFWNYLTCYGHSLTRWTFVALLITGVIFPLFYLWQGAVPDRRFASAIVHSLAGAGFYRMDPTPPGTSSAATLEIVQSCFTFFWLGTLVSIISTRTQE